MDIRHLIISIVLILYNHSVYSLTLIEKTNHIDVNETSENDHSRIDTNETNKHITSFNSINEENDLKIRTKQESVKINLRPIIGNCIFDLMITYLKNI